MQLNVHIALTKQFYHQEIMILVGITDEFLNSVTGKTNPYATPISSVGVATRLWAGEPILGRLRHFLLSTASRTAIRPIQSPIPWVQGAEQHGLEADYFI
jgi:alkanesulfonate monooxygenase SsuD/methylene tetrahydromethanopterin reductase-like flavin-dependent oxidoreductase (luciferase family)